MITAEDVHKILTGPKGRPMKRRELARALGVGEREYPEFRALIHEMLRGGRLVKLKRGRLAPPDPLNLAVGIFSQKSQGYGFVTVDERDDLAHVFIKAGQAGTALDGDRVLVRLSPEKTGPTPEGRVIKVLERGEKLIAGIFGKTKYSNHVRPDPPSPLTEIYIHPAHTKKAQPGQQVLVKIEEWPSPDLTPEGRITKVLGFPDDPGVDIQRIIHDHGLPGAFPRPVLAESRALPETISAKDLKGRSDFRDNVVFTIDPATAKDFDDAISIDETKNGWRVGVHIADVAHYVTPGSKLDEEGYQRATSVYLVDRVIPMLPPRLSNNMCSLKPNVDRLTMSCLAEIDKQGKITRFELCNSVIHSRARLTYRQVMDFFSSGTRGKIKPEVAAKLTIARAASAALRAARFKAGSLNLETPEVNIILDDQGVPIRIELDENDESHQLIEDLMLMANRCVAGYFLRLNAPTLYRIHAQPDKEKMSEFAAFVSHLGLSFSTRGGVTSQKLGRFLDRIQTDSRRATITNILLRSLKKAEYSPENVGHFGLGFNHYLHFTSPIRRYPDLWVHRHLKKLLAKKLTVTQKKKIAGDLPAIGRWTSERERAAMQAERDSVLIKQLQYLNARLGDEYTGTISGFLEFGFFVTLEGVWADGLVRFSGIDDDYYHYDPEKYQVKGRRTGRTFRLGDKVRVRLIKVNNARKEIDLIMADAPLENSTKRKWGKRGRHSPR